MDHKYNTHLSQRIIFFPSSIVNFRLLILFLMVSLFASCSQNDDTILLNGRWALSLQPGSDPNIAGISSLEYDLEISLPGTLDDAGIGNPNPVEIKLDRDVMQHLHRKVKYTGPAYYSREIDIPSNWSDKHITLNLERVLWESVVWVNGNKVGNNFSLSTAHVYDLSRFLIPGKNTLVICIDNSKKFDLNSHDLAHAYTDHTQIIWNGILGDITLKAIDRHHVSDLVLYPDFAGKSVSGLVQTTGSKSAQHRVQVKIFDQNNRQTALNTYLVTGSTTPFSLTLEADPVPWNEFSPALYSAEVSLLDQKGIALHTQKVSFGFRDLEARNSRFFINDEPIFLRGTLECCIFPLTGHPPMLVDEWKDLFGAAKDFGLNHLRFHSWCPPKAAFEAADQMGMYLQVELPNWILNFGQDIPTVNFLHEEADAILNAYGNHPSFVLLSLGNELQGDMELFAGLLAGLKKKDNRRLYTTTSFTFEKGHGLVPEKLDDFFITQYTDKGWVRGQGVFDQYPPRFNADYADAITHIGVPLITHEIGQYSVYPDMSEIEKYTGVLQPLNFLAVRNDLAEKGLLDRAARYTEATGKFATLLYKEEIERALKTNGVDGFQLLDLHDFSGQGTALVGVLNAFWEPKGFVEGRQWREFCSEVVPLLWFGKAVYTSSETFSARVGIANYKHAFHDTTISWALQNQQGQTLKSDRLSFGHIPAGESSILDSLNINLSDLTAPAKYKLVISLEGTTYSNQWEIWVYSDELIMPESDILVTASFTEAISALEKGRTVLLSTSPDKIEGIEGKFVPVFWSPVHFPDQPGTMGLLVEPEHPAFRHFPTDFYSNWQWWDLCKNSKTLHVDHLDMEPLVTVIDNFFHNRRLSNVFQAQVGSGKLLFSAIDLHTQLDDRPVARQLKYSLLSYMSSPDFAPQKQLPANQLMKLSK